VVALHECAFGLWEDKSGKALREAIEEGFNENAYTLPQWCQSARAGGFQRVSVEFFSFIEDYLERKRQRGARRTWKIAAAEFIARFPWLHGLIHRLTIVPRIVLRPKAWKMIAVKAVE